MACVVRCLAEKTELKRPCIPQQRSFVVSLRSAVSVLELIVATGISAARNAATWLFIKASRGETTIVIPWSIIAGNWKHKLFLVTASIGLWKQAKDAITQRK